MYNILICDDEPDIRSALKIYLSGEGYGIFEAENGSQALDIIAKEEISLLLMDVMMPVMDGITALSTLRKTSNIPVILLTAKSQDFDKVSGLNAGADDYITKPFVPVEVIARVRSQLRRYKRLGGAAEPLIAAELRTHAGNDLHGHEGLGYVVVRTGVEAADLVEILALCREQYHGNV